MTNQEVLEKAMRKAMENTGVEYAYTMSELLEDIPAIQDFAKALWGEHETSTLKENGEPISDDYMGSRGMYRVTNEGWQHHLRQMVIADDPIKYLGENI